MAAAVEEKKEEPSGVYVYSPKPPLETTLTAKDLSYTMNVIRGVPVNPTFKQDEVEKLIETFPARPTDVFICTYPKCGTTWTQQIVHLLTHGGEQGDTTIYDTAPWLEAIFAHPILHEREANNLTLEDLEARTTQRLFKSHANYPDVPCGGKPCKVITISRNPKVCA